MTTRPGNPTVGIAAAAALAVAGGRNIVLQNSAQVITAISVVWVATATVGNRVPVIRILDPSGNILWSAAFATAVTAGQTSRLMAGGGIPATNVASPIQQTFPLPYEMAVPAASSIQVLDAANIDVADTVAVNTTVSF